MASYADAFRRGSVQAAPAQQTTTTPTVNHADYQSFGYIIRNILFDALDQREPFFQNFVRRRNKMLVVMPEYLPYLGVYIIDERMVPDGDANQPPIKFQHTLNLGFSVMVANNDQDVAEQQIDQAYWRIMNRLWTDPVIMNVLDATAPNNPDNIRIESLTRGTRRHVFGATQLNNTTPIAELQYDVSVFFRSYWRYVPVDDLEVIHVETGIKPGDTQAEMDRRWQIKRDYLQNP